MIYQLLVVLILLAAVIVVYLRLYRQNLIPGLPLPATPTAMGLQALDTSSKQTPLEQVAPPDATRQPTPPEQTAVAETPPDEMPLPALPLATDSPIPPPDGIPSPTPAFGFCHYTLKSGPRDFLYAIYWNWHINKNIPYVQDFYARITCAPLLSNLECNYHAGNPNVVQPGWVLALPGVRPEICRHYGGVPAP